jgi:polygalacturonase
MIFHNCEFSLSRAINIVQSSNITIEELHIINSIANNNNLVHISLSKDLKFENVTVHNISKNSPGMVALFNVF